MSDEQLILTDHGRRGRRTGTRKVVVVAEAVERMKRDEDNKKSRSTEKY